VATAAVMRASHRAARVTAAPAAALRSLSCEVRDSVVGCFLDEVGNVGDGTEGIVGSLEV